MNLFVSYAHVNLCHFSLPPGVGLAVTSACGYFWSFLFTFFQMKNKILGTMMFVRKKRIVFTYFRQIQTMQNRRNRVNMVKARSEYKTVIRRCRYQFDRDKTDKFASLKNKIAKQY